MSEVTDVELLQMKLVYAALYVSLDLVELHQVVNVNWYMRRRTKIFKASTTVTSDDYADDVSLTSSNVRTLEEISGNVPLGKRFVDLQKLVKAFKKTLGHMPRNQAMVVWRWMSRQSADLLVLRYIRQNKGSKNAVKAIAATIRMQATSIHGPQEMYRGEQYYINVEPDPIYINRYEIGRVTIIGVNKDKQPIILIRSAIESAHESKKLALRRAAEVVCEIAYMCQDEELNGSTIIFDMSGYSLKHMDRHFAAYMGELQNTAFPGLCSKVYIWDAPKLFRTLWGAVKRFYDPEIQDIRTFTSDHKVLMENIDPDQLPPELGGTGPSSGWTLPNEADDLPMKDLKTRQRLLDEREALLDQLQDLTCSWLAGESNMYERKQLIKKCKRNYFELDPYVRRRTMFDRNGIMGRCRREFLPGGISQPVCGVDLKSARIGGDDGDSVDAILDPSAQNSSSIPATEPIPEQAKCRQSTATDYESITGFMRDATDNESEHFATPLSDIEATPEPFEPVAEPTPVRLEVTPEPVTTPALAPSTSQSLSPKDRGAGDPLNVPFARDISISPRTVVEPMSPSSGWSRDTPSPRTRSVHISLLSGHASTSSVALNSPAPVSAGAETSHTPSPTIGGPSYTRPATPPSASSASTGALQSEPRLLTKKSGVLKSPSTSPTEAENAQSELGGESKSAQVHTSTGAKQSKSRAMCTSAILMKPLPALDPEQLARDRAAVSASLHSYSASSSTQGTPQQSPTNSSCSRKPSNASTEVESLGLAKKTLAWGIHPTVIDT